MKKFYIFSGALMVLSLFCNSNQASAQSALQTSADEVCICLDEKVENDTTELNPNELLNECAVEAMTKNRVELAKETDMGTVEGIRELRNKFVDLLNKDCDRFREIFVQNQKK